MCVQIMISNYNVPYTHEQAHTKQWYIYISGIFIFVSALHKDFANR